MRLPRLPRSSFAALALVTSLGAIGVACATSPTDRPAVDDTLPDGAPATLPDGAPATLPDGAPATLPDGAPATLPDGAPVPLPDASTDGAVLADGAVVPTNRVSCGGTFCRGDQACVSGRCEFSCTGTQVPGDYATLANAVSALNPTGGTICLKAGTFSENVSITGNPGKTLTIVGLNAATTKVSSITVGTGYDTVTIRGIDTSLRAQGGNSNGQQAKLEAIAIAGEVYAQSNGPNQHIIIDGANLGGTAASPKSYGLYVYPGSGGGSPKVTLTNSYIHDTNAGVYIYNYYGTSEVSVVNSTFVSNEIGINVVGGGRPLTLTYSNNIFLNQRSFAVALAQAVQNLVHENNLLFGNQNNYSGTAADGAGYLKVDPMLDTGAPPEPRQGSPARRSSLASRAPAVDFYGIARGASSDRGCVQSP